jgi:hypothetical protein
MAVEHEGAAVQVAAHLGRLPDAQVPQLHFLEIRIDPQEFSGITVISAWPA